MSSPHPPASGQDSSENISEVSENDNNQWVDQEWETEGNWIDEVAPAPPTPAAKPKKARSPIPPEKLARSLPMVETAFLASTASLIWLVNYYFPFGPVLKVFVPLPITLVYLRWGLRACSMSAAVSGLLLSVLMGPIRSLIFIMPYGLMSIQLGAFWRRKSPWRWSIAVGTIIGTFGLFFRFWLFSILLGEDLWIYIITQVTEFLEWLLLRLGLLIEPNFVVVQLMAIAVVVLNNLLYLLAVHLVALIMLDRLGNPIPRPPQWVLRILDYE